MRPAQRLEMLYPVTNPLARWLAIEPAKLLAFFPLNEGSGSNIIDVSRPQPSSYSITNGYAGVTWGGTLSPTGEPVPLWDGTSDYGNIYTAALAAAFNGAEGTIALWAKVSAAGVWTDGTTRRLINIRVNISNALSMSKSSVSGTISWAYAAGGIPLTIAAGSQSSLGWFHVALTWDKAADQFKAYLNGQQSGSTVTGLGIWAGALTATECAIGAFNTIPNNVHSGYLSNVYISSKALTQPQIASLATP